MNDDTNGTRVERIRVEGLFGLYNHDIQLKKEERITIVHGPNGVGKTVLFKLTDALLNGRSLELLKYPFQRFEVSLTNGERIEVLQEQDEKNSPSKTIRKYKNGKQIGKKIALNAKEVKRWAERIEHFTPIHKINSGRWFDTEYDDTLDDWGVIERYGKLTPDGNEMDISAFHRDEKLPFVYLIAAQRLIHLGKSSGNDGFPMRMPSSLRSRVDRADREPISFETVLNYSRELRRKIAANLAEYGRKSQELDQSFPQRLLQWRVESFTESKIREQMQKIKADQERLQQLGLMADAPNTHGVEGELDESKRPVMTVYLSDMAQKLVVLDTLAKKIEVLLTQVNEQFVNKKLVLDEQHELAVHTAQGERLPLSILSSGEQHQIVLVYDLLFHVKPNTLVMIDEPELSLHMDWQERFIGNLEKIIAVSNIDIVLATHSPYIVNGHNELLVSLSADPVATTHT